MNILSGIKDIQKNIALTDYTTFRIGGPAKFFLLAKYNEEIIKAIEFAQNKNIPWYIFGGGSHILASDKGFDGLVIKTINSQFNVEGDRIIAEAGTLLGSLVIGSINQGLTGLEWAIGIPGTIAGAVFGNAGAYGHSISENVESVSVFDLEAKKIEVYEQNDCGFAYRGSRFKEKGEIIIQVTLKFERGDKEESQRQIKDLILERKTKNPPYPSAGCIFKNIRIVELNIEQADGRFITKTGREIPKEKIRSGKFATGYLIDQCGLKGKQIGQAKIADEHANFIINLGGAKANDVIELINLCKEKVKENFGIELEEEIRYLGF